MDHLRIDMVKKCRKRHECNECWSWVEKGEPLRRDIVAADGTIFTHITCSICLAFFETISRNDRSDYYYTDEYTLADHPKYNDFVAERALLGL